MVSNPMLRTCAAVITSVLIAPGLRGQCEALLFDGVDDMIEVPNFQHTLDAFTIEAWVRKDPTDFFFDTIVATPAFRFQIERNENLEFWAVGDLELFDRSRLVKVDGTWEHVAVTWEEGFVTFWLNGEPLGAGASGFAPMTIAGLRIGYDGLTGLGGNDPFDGALDEVRFWDHARTQEEIIEFAGESLSGKEPGLLGYWPMEGGEGQEVSDLSTSGSDVFLGATGEVEPMDPQWISLATPGEFIRGDVEHDEALFITDAITILSFLFLTEDPIIDCGDAADVDDSGEIDISDAIGLLNFLFVGGLPPPRPFPTSGPDPTEDMLGCERAEGCLERTLE